MAELLFTVTRAVSLEGRGFLLGPGIGPDHAMALQIGDEVELQVPDGETLNTSVQGLTLTEAAGFEKPRPVFVSVRTKKVLPVGTRVYRIERRDQ